MALPDEKRRPEGAGARAPAPRSEDAEELRRELSLARDELSSKDRRLAQLSHDIENLLATVDVPVVVLDDRARLRLATPTAGRILGVGRRDLGRSIGEVSSSARMPELGSLVAEVLETARPTERRVIDRAGEAYVVRAAPYLVEDGRCEGCVLAFLDAERARRKSLEESSRLLASLNRIDTAINSLNNVDQIMTRVVDEASLAVGASSAALFKHEGGAWTIAYVHSLPKDLLGRHYSEEELPYLQSTIAPGLTIIEDDYGIGPGDEPALPRQHMLLAVQLAVRGEVIGVLVFGFRDHVPFNAAKLDFARRLARSVSVALENASAYSAQRRVADCLQESLLTLPDRVPGVEHAALYRAANVEARVGGDFYDLYELPDGTVAIAIGDVSGKGLDAATLTSLARNALRAHAMEGHGPAEVVARTNHLVHHFTPSETFLTAFFSLLDPGTGAMRYCSAGHPPAIVVGEKGATPLPGLDPMIGAFPDVAFHESAATLGDGETLIAYTDGIVEARSGRELYGELRALACTGSLREEPPAEVLTGLLQDVLHFSDGRLRDDVAMLAVRRLPPGSAER